MPSLLRRRSDTPSWLARQSLNAGLRTAYQLMCQQNKRVMMADFEVRDGARTVLLAARGARVQDVEQLLYDHHSGVEAVAAPVSAVAPSSEASGLDDVSAAQRRDLSSGVRAALAHMKRQDKSLMRVELDDSAPEPLLLVIARGAEARVIAQRVNQYALLDTL